MLIGFRWIHFMAVTMLFGSCLWWLIEPVGSVAQPARDAIVKRTTILVRLASPVAIASGVGWLVCSLAGMTGTLQSILDPDTIRLYFFDTPFGAVLMMRVVLLSILLLVAFAPLSNHLRLIAVVILTGLLLVSQAWLGHATQGGPGLLGTTMIIVYAIHVLAAGAWVGALPALILSVTTRSDHSEIHVLLRRYSAIATAAVVAIITTGTLNTLFRSNGSLAALVASTYGTVLLVKLCLVASMLACAAWHRFVAMPRLRHGGARSIEVFTLRTSLSLELALGTLVLGVAAVLGVTPPPA